MSFIKDWRFWFVAAAAAGLLTAPLWVSGYSIYLISLVVCVFIAALGLNVLTGVAGQIVLAHHIFLALGAYGTAILMQRAGLPLLAAIVLSGFITVFLALILAVPALRLAGFELAIASLAFGAIFERAVIKLSRFTGGAMGLTLKKWRFLGLSSDLTTYWFILAAAVLIWIGTRNILRGRIGRAWFALRDSEVAAEAMGVSIPIYKMLSYSVSAFLGAVAGGFYAQLIGYLSPEHFVLWLTITYTAMIVLGGLGAILGSLIGAIFFTLLPEMLQGFEMYQGLVFGLVLIASMGFLPRGIISLPSLLQKFRRSPQVPVEEENPVVRQPPGGFVSLPSLLRKKLGWSPQVAVEEGNPVLRKPVRASASTGPAVKEKPGRRGNAEIERTAPPLVDVKDLTVKFGGNTALLNVNMKVYNNQIFGLIGPNGAGKTVLFNCLTGFLRPTEGSIHVNGTSLIGKKTWHITGLGLARTFQNSQIVPALSVLDNVMLGAHRHLKANLFSSALNLPSVAREEKAHRQRAMEFLSLLHIDHIADVPADSLSIAHRRLVEVARALMPSPGFSCLTSQLPGSQRRRPMSWPRRSCAFGIKWGSPSS